jgi:hypothetical protein
LLLYASGLLVIGYGLHRNTPPAFLVLGVVAYSLIAVYRVVRTPGWGGARVDMALAGVSAWLFFVWMHSGYLTGPLPVRGVAVAFFEIPATSPVWLPVAGFCFLKAVVVAARNVQYSRFWPIFLLAFALVSFGLVLRYAEFGVASLGYPEAWRRIFFAILWSHLLLPIPVVLCLWSLGLPVMEPLWAPLPGSRQEREGGPELRRWLGVGLAVGLMAWWINGTWWLGWDDMEMEDPAEFRAAADLLHDLSRDPEGTARRRGRKVPGVYVPMISRAPDLSLYIDSEQGTWRLSSIRSGSGPALGYHTLATGRLPEPREGHE